MQFIFDMGVMVRLEQLGTGFTHLPHEFRAVIFQRFNRFLKYHIVAMQSDGDPLLFARFVAGSPDTRNTPLAEV
jgi:hypothetical protein